MILNNEFIQMFSNCLTVKGHNRSLIIDTQREGFHFITNDLYEIIETDFPVRYDELIEKYGEPNIPILNSYLEYLFERELIFTTNEPERFPKMLHDWDVPRQISNGILDIDEHSSYDILKGVREMDSLGAEAIQLRFFGDIEISRIENLIQEIEKTTHRLRVLELMVKFNTDTDYTFFLTSMMVSSLILYKAPFNKVERDDLYGTMVISTSEEITGADHCGVILPQYFTPRIDFVLEAQKFNTCLNKKMSIDVNGNIKNCPSMAESFGHIDRDRLADILGNPGIAFTNKWSIKKDDVLICRDCEFRLICSDCRAYTENGDYSKPAKCGYDPYTNEWNKSLKIRSEENISV